MHKQTLLHCLIGGLVTVSIAACVWPSPPPTGQPVSPPPEVLNSTLINRSWRLDVAILQGEVLTFDYYRPVYVHFSKEGTVSIHSERCGSSSFLIVYLGEQRYHIGDGVSTAEDCGGFAAVNCAEFDDKFDRIACEHGKAIEAQRTDLGSALKSTSEYELREDELILRGEEAEMRLVLDNP